MSVNIKDMNTRDEVRLLLLEQSHCGIFEEFKQINTKIDALSKDTNSKIDKLENKIDSMDKKFDAKIDKLYWFIIGLYGTSALYFIKSFF